ncbi:MAG: amino acid ABC transporter substrate-binding protein [Candidatus Lambdaproteobacteria bacterium]|nr:amino acid ABC transporter substrate-binding protein [Candidatus Lambdaproteobacteria bacterium]
MLGAVVAFGAIPASAATTLETIRSRGQMICGVNNELPGFGYVDAQGNYSGFDVDFCRAVGAALGVDVRFRALTPRDRFSALQSGEVDVLSRNTTWTISRDTNLGLDFVATTYYDGQGFMVRKSLGVKSAKELGGASVCLTTGTTTELNLADWFRANGLQYKPVLFEKADDALKAYEAGRCDVHTSDKSQLASLRSAAKNPGEHVLMPEVISKEPLGPLTRHGDNQWADIVRWTVNALITAEELGVTKANVDQVAKSSKNPEVQRLLGTTGSLGKDMGVGADWALKAIKAVGNYGEIYDRNVGPQTKLALERGLNQLWSKGGILFSPPFR